VKVDCSFVLDVNPDGEGATIISAVCSLAKATGRTVIAEGVEQPYQPTCSIA
jgi:EAL domain-containing protein (putative c-di-GMP-specific phosphodiesterase class I)